MRRRMNWIIAAVMALTLAVAPATGVELSAQEMPCDATCVNTPDPPSGGGILVCVLVATIIVVDGDGNVLSVTKVYACTLV